MKKNIFCLGAALMALAACGAPAPDATAEDSATEQAAGADADEAASPRLLLTAQGIMPDGSEAGRIAFGANSLDTVEAVIAVLGETYDQDQSEECGAGPMEFAMWDDVWLGFQQGEFVGWELRDTGNEPRAATPGGITIGSSRADLEAAIDGVSVAQSSLGTEFDGGGFSGLLSSDAPDATVTALWAGTSCVMR